MIRKSLKKVIAVLLCAALCMTGISVSAEDFNEGSAYGEEIQTEDGQPDKVLAEDGQSDKILAEDETEIQDGMENQKEDSLEGKPEEETGALEGSEEITADSEESEGPHILYQSQIQTDGWQEIEQDGGTSGTVGQSKRMEAVKIHLENQPYEGDIEYCSHIQNSGWETRWAQNGEISGTVGEFLRLEAIRIRLTGDMEAHYDVYYRVYAQEFGWLGWAKNGENAGTESFGYRLEGIQIVLVEKDEAAPGNTEGAFCQRPSVYYQSHGETYGWQNEVKNSQVSGTTGKSKRLEAVKIRLDDQLYDGNIEYRTHIEDLGWETSWKSNGELSGTTGKALQMEAIQIRLTGELAQRFDVYYRVHAQEFGWLGWAKNGESAGTEGFNYRLEGLQIILVKKGTAAPGSVANAFHKFPSVAYQTHVQTDGWKNEVKNGATGGTVGEFKRMESLKIRLIDQDIKGNIEYRSHIQNLGWETSWKSNGELSGTTGRSLRLEAVQIRLTGDLARYFDIYYRVHAQQYGWLGWAKNGESAGTEGCSYRLEAVQIRIVKKGAAAPGSTARAFVKSKTGWFYENGYKYYYKSGVRQTDIRGVIGRQSSYLIKINKQMSCVTVYAKDGNKGYIIPVVAFACSPGAGTPIGTFRTSDKYRWHALFGAQGQWCTRITGHILFHSLPYTSFNNRTMMPNQYNRLGTWASSGCIRLRAIDAKWIYDNCTSGTTVTIYNSSAAGPLGKPVYAKIPAYQNWDPTDPTI